MTDKAKASEHDLREGSKPEVNELLKLEKSATPGPWKIIEGRQSDYPYSIHGNSGGRIIVWGGIARKSSAEGQANAKLIVAMRNQLAAILEENQRLAKELDAWKEVAKDNHDEDGPRNELSCGRRSEDGEDAQEVLET